MKPLLNLSLQRSYRFCLDFCLQHSLPFCYQTPKLLPLRYVSRQPHFVHHYHSHPGKYTFVTAVCRNVKFTSCSMQTWQHRKHYHHLNSVLSQSTKKDQNIDLIKKSRHNTTTPNYDTDLDTLSPHVKDSHSSHVILDRYIYVKTLTSLYEDVTNGIILDTAYGDSRPNADFDSSVPVVVALHDTPGSHADVVPLLNFFAKLGCRTICPTFPGHGNTRGIMRNFDDIFSQTTMERATFVHDFLLDLDVRRVDVLIGVGASSHTAMALCTRQTEVYKSMALLSPWPLTQPRFSINSKMLERIHELWEMVYFRPLARLFLPAFKVEGAVTPDEKIAACYLVQNMDLGEADSFALTASMQNVPRLMAYGGKDDLVGEELYEDLLSKLSINSDHVICDHQRGQGEDLSSQPKALRFPDSGYDILTTHRSVLCAHILRLLQRFHPSVKI